jgi:hypothetical protein
MTEIYDERLDGASIIFNNAQTLTFVGSKTHFSFSETKV